MRMVRARITAKPATSKAAPKLSNEQRLLCEQLRPVLRAMEVEFDVRGSIQCEPEHYGIPGRKHRIDVAIKNLPYGAPLAIEIDGGIFMKRARHSGGVGQLKDMEKLNLLTQHGWRILKFTPQQVMDGTALAQIERCL